LDRYVSGIWQTFVNPGYVQTFVIGTDGAVYATFSSPKDQVCCYLGDSTSIVQPAAGFFSRIWNGIVTVAEDVGAIALAHIDPSGHLGRAVYGDQFWDRAFAGAVIEASVAISVATAGLLAPEGAVLTTTIIAGGVGSAAGDAFSQIAYAGFDLATNRPVKFNLAELGLSFGEGLVTGALKGTLNGTASSADSPSPYDRAYLMSPDNIASQLQANSASVWMQPLSGGGVELGQVAENFVFGVNGTATAFQDVDASFGIFFSPGTDKLGAFVSAGASQGVNVSGSVFFGVTYDGASTAINTNFTCGPFGLTIINDPSTGQYLGFTFGVGPGLTPCGASVTYGSTWQYGVSPIGPGLDGLPPTALFGHQW
jgi:hypothetical protein